MTPLIELAMHQISAGNIDEAHEAVRLAQEAGEPETLICQLKGRVHMRQHEWIEAYDYMQRAVWLDPEDADAWINLGMATYEMGLWEEAAAYYRRTILMIPRSPIPWLKLGAANGMMQKHGEAFACFEMAVGLDPACADAHHALAVQYGVMGFDDWAVTHERKAQELSLDGEHTYAVAGEGASLLRMGKWLEGWPKFEARHRLPAFGLPWWYKTHAPFTETDIESAVMDKRVLIWCEQGFGDSIHMSRYVPLIVDMAREVTLETQSEAKRLFSLLPCNVIEHTKDMPPDVDVRISLMSLPYLFKTTQDTVPPPFNFGFHPTFRKRPGMGKIGVCWAGGARRHEPLANAVDQRRSLTKEQFQPILDAISYPRMLMHEKDHPGAALKGDWLDTAERIADLDLVITVDTAICHLAASMGIETWMLSRFDACWRWGFSGETTPWYPTMKIYRQPYLGDWDAVIKRVVNDLKERDNGNKR